MKCTVTLDIETRDDAGYQTYTLEAETEAQATMLAIQKFVADTGALLASIKNAEVEVEVKRAERQMKRDAVTCDFFATCKAAGRLCASERYQNNCDHWLAKNEALYQAGKL